ncbi:carbonic anhydrase 2-like isoform X2 [Pecten maximus]|uniref:carbonic anhydrase 2-like isoform X2 n=1 Tax=Pecten maximus TaxID=6579 RepID=UPI001457F966|nr:carbonic anhydrase 2-like isoform X2 [Pecten maximus]
MMASALLLFAVLFLGTVDSSHIKTRKSGEDQWEDCPDIENFFSYDPNSPCGPQHWHKRYPLCGADKQSPINIDTDKTSRENDGRVHYKHAGKVEGIFENNGRAPNFVVKEDHLRNILIMDEDEDNDNGDDNGDDNRYVFRELHFHIGAKGSSYGSEHTVNNKGYKGEIHMVHRKLQSDENDNDNGDDDQQEILVLGRFFNVIENCCSYADHLISRYITNIPNYLDETEAHVEPSRMLPRDGKFYKYVGSTTTPMCIPDVLWILFKTPTTVCEKNLQDSYGFRNMGSWESSIKQIWK